MIGIFLDQFLCSLFEMNSTESDDFLISLASWLQLKSEKWFVAAVSNRTHQLLFEDQKLIQQAHLIANARSFVNAETIMSSIFTLIDQPTSEDKFGVVDILASNMELSPSLGNIECNAELCNDIKAVLETSLAIGTYAVNMNKEIPLRFSSFKTKSKLFVQEIEADLYVELIESDGQIGEYEASLSASIWTCPTAKEFLISVDPVQEWIRSKSVDGLRLSIKAACAKLADKLNKEIEWKELDAFAFHPKFLEYLWDHGFNNEPRKIRRLLRACAETILKLNLDAVHALRTTSSGGARQRLRGNDKAFRRDIDYEYHLHYWDTADGPQFCTVGPHEYFDIPS
ncbi:MAG: hypothetical protein K2X27_12580 [Candidatus Obscuribacterales bacterium]|nr:hypothetical protein [Candidatus Obscuribacterales bacterium]